MLLSKIDLNDFDKVFEIMQESFPEDEYRTYNNQKKLLDNKNYVIYAIKDDLNNSIKAFITIYEFQDLIFIEHFAVNREYRNQGLGGVILKELLSGTRKKVCLEVEIEKNEMAKRRIGFYKRNGFVLNEFYYEQPPISDNHNFIPMHIMSYQNALSSSEFKAVKELLYDKVYSCSL